MAKSKVANSGEITCASPAKVSDFRKHLPEHEFGELLNCGFQERESHYEKERN